MVGAPPPKKGVSVAAIVLIALVVLSVSGLGGCLVCVYAFGGSRSSAQADGSAPGGWITSNRPYVKFRKPAGWSEELKGDWGIFKSPDGTAVYAFTTFSQPGESTVRLGRAASVLGVSDIAWGSPEFGTIGPESFKAHMGEGGCTFEGTHGYIWYATVDPGSVEQILLIYTVSGRGSKADKDAVIASVKSLQHR